MTDDLFGWADGASLRDAGVTLASAAQEAETPGWGDRAYAAIVSIARSQATVHVDDVLRVFHEQPAHFNAWGSVWIRAIKEGVITRTGTVRETSDRRKHRHHYPVYKSEVYRG